MFGISFISSVSGLFELVTRGIFVIDVTDATFLIFANSLDSESINDSVSVAKISFSLSVTVRTKNHLIYIFHSFLGISFRSLSSSKIRVSADASSLKLPTCETDITSITARKSNTSSGWQSI